MKVVLTTKGEWSVIPGERVATITGKEEDDVNNAARDIIAVKWKDNLSTCCTISRKISSFI